MPSSPSSLCMGVLRDGGYLPGVTLFPPPPGVLGSDSRRGDSPQGHGPFPIQVSPVGEWRAGRPPRGRVLLAPLRLRSLRFRRSLHREALSGHLWIYTALGTVTSRPALAAFLRLPGLPWHPLNPLSHPRGQLGMGQLSRSGARTSLWPPTIQAGNSGPPALASQGRDNPQGHVLS